MHCLYIGGSADSNPSGTRERHLESILQPTLRQVLLVHNFPRTLIQITLQIISTPGSSTTGSKLVQATSVCNLPSRVFAV